MGQVRLGLADSRRIPYRLQLQQATLALEAAQAQYDKVLKGSTADVTAGAYAQLVNARAQLDRLLTETAAYRAYFLNAPPAALVRSQSSF